MGRILVIDDDRVGRTKLVLAAGALGYETVEAEGGAAGLARLAEGGIDLVLLDLLMPEVDGYEVLRRRAASPALAEVPVLVISGVDDVAGIARAIELGAEDVLPRSFKPALLRARIDAALTRRRLRQAEASDLERVHRLAAAAQIIEGTRFDPRRLGLSAMGAMQDDLGRLARVFLDMAAQVHRREEALRTRIALLTGTLLLIAYGAANGLQPTLSRLMADAPIDTLGLAAGSLVAGAGLAGAAALLMGGAGLPPRGRLLALLGYATVSLAVPRICILLAAETIPAQQIALLLAGQSLLVFAIGTALGMERASLRRLAGLLLGIAGITTVVFAGAAGRGTFVDGGAMWLVVAAVIGTAAGVVCLSLGPRAPRTGPLAEAAMAMGFAAVGVSALAAASGALPDAEAVWSTTGLLMAALGGLGAVATLAMIVVVPLAGPVFASQAGCASAVGGVLWAVALIDEPFTWVTATALGLLCLGLLLVMPRRHEQSLDEALGADPRLHAARARLKI